MPDQPTRTRLRAALVPSIALVLTVMAVAVMAVAGGAPASAAGPGGAPAGPALISPLGHPRLCWQAEGNGTPVGLEPCDSSIEGQLWTLNGNGVLLNGNGYCLQRGGGASGQPASTLFLSFDGQCAGAPSQTWAFSGATNEITNPAAGTCAAEQDGADVPGEVIINRPCEPVAAGQRWSFGSSRLTLSGSSRARAGTTGAGASGAGANGASATRASATGASATAASATGASADGASVTGAGATGAGAASVGRSFASDVTVTNVAGAMTAYGAVVWLRPPRGLTVTRLAAGGALRDWTCTVRELRCQGNLPGGQSGSITVLGSVRSRSAARAITVHGRVTRTNEPRQGVRPVIVPVRFFTTAAAAGAAAAAALPGSGGRRGPAAGSTVKFVLIIAGLLVAMGVALAYLTRRRRRPPAHAAKPPRYPAVVHTARNGTGTGIPPDGQTPASRAPRNGTYTEGHAAVAPTAHSDAAPANNGDVPTNNGVAQPRNGVAPTNNGAALVSQDLAARSSIDATPANSAGAASNGSVERSSTGT